ncbi:MAG: Rrf2 family transcriptional regulator [Candidatus Hydrogenedentes bacterium]|nr:Rrf2 family transcriptional regulator [Candidatus Hydrogenedentota bacterium]
MVSKTAVHALRAMVVLAGLPKGVYLGAGAIAKQAGAPQNYLGKLLQTLAREGLVISQKGLGGGFRLARDIHEISLFDVVDPIDQLSRWSGCFLGQARCDGKAPCALHFQWLPLREAYLKLLSETTVADLAETPELSNNLIG